MTTTRKTYKTLVADYIEAAVARHNLTRQEVAERLELKKRNYISMLLNPDDPSLLSPMRIPALARLCGLTAKQSLALLHRRVADHPERPVRLSLEVFELLVASSMVVMATRSAAKVAAAAGVTCGS